MLTLSFKAAKEGFFDRKAITDRLDKATRDNFNEFGRNVRKRAQKSIVYADRAAAGPQKRDVRGRFLSVERTSRSAPAGQPPYGHKTGTRSRTSKSTGKTRTRRVSLLREFIFYTFDKQSQSVVIGPARLNGTISSQALPALEYGGPSIAKIKGRRVRVTIAAHPFMRPAAAAELPSLPAQWRDSVR